MEKIRTGSLFPYPDFSGPQKTQNPTESFAFRQRSNSFEIESPTLQKLSQQVLCDEEDLDRELLENQSQEFSTGASSAPKNTLSSSSRSKGSKVSSQGSKSRKRNKQPQEKYGASPALLDEQKQNAFAKSFDQALIFAKALMTRDHYSFFYYTHKHGPAIEEEARVCGQNPNCGKMLAVYPDILYSQSYDGEIAIEKLINAKSIDLNLITLIDVTGVADAKLDVIHQTATQLLKATHPNLLRLVEKPILLQDVQTLVVKTESPDHISTWKQFCKTQMSLFHTLSIFRQMSSAVAHLNSLGIIHRDVHPTRVHMLNGIVKFNMVGLPYNFKKLIKSSVYSGHLSYTAPELIQGQKETSAKIDTWALGCSFYYLATKQDPFQGSTVDETKQNILALNIDTTEQLKFQHAILSKLIYQCLERDPAKRMTAAELISFQDELETQTFGLPLSRLHYEVLERQDQLSNQLQQRVATDASTCDYTGTSLDLRNNPWFFSKTYTVPPMFDDEDFYFLIETKVGSSKQLRLQLGAQQELLRSCLASVEKSRKPHSRKNQKQLPPRRKF